METKTKGRGYVETLYIEEAAEIITESNLKVRCAKEVHVIKAREQASDYYSL